MPKRIVLALIVAASVLAPRIVHADVPTIINFQGILLDSVGFTVADSTYSLIFRIWDAAAGGGLIWDETQIVTTENGLFSTALGAADPILGSFFDSPDRWLEMELSGSGTPYVPRTKMGSVAYAYRVGTVDAATGGTISGDVAVSGGNVTLDASSATAGNILKGGIPFLHNYGNQNTFIGLNAGNLSMTGINNAANGYGALFSNTTGSANTAIGARTLESNTTGFANTASGYHALGDNTAGNSNTAIGDESLLNNTTGNSNTATGFAALNRNMTGASNTAGGFQALFNNISGNFNTATGSGALYSNTTGNLNAASGSNALRENTTGLENTANGANALQNNTAGNVNTANGANALQNNTSGQGNTASGRNALLGNTTGSNNTASGLDALISNTTGNHNTASGRSALFSNTTGIDNTAIGSGADVSSGNLTNATAIGFEAVVNASNKIRLGNAAVTVIEGQVAFTFPSDKNQKENFRAVDGDEVLRKIRGLNLASWNYKGHDPEEFRHYGPVAQEFFAAFGHDGVGTSGTPTTINSGDEAGILMIAVQALEKRTAEVEAIKAQNQALQSQIDDLREMIRVQGNVPK